MDPLKLFIPITKVDVAQRLVGELGLPDRDGPSEGRAARRHHGPHLRQKYSMADVNTLDIKVHPNMPAGTIFFTTSKLPYAISNITNLMQMRMGQD